MNINLPKISVIMVTKNAAKYLESAIKSVVDQNYPNFEILALDAASTDCTIEIFNKYKQYISYMRSHKDNGANEAYNEGIAKATGQLITLLNSDDFYEGNSLMQAAESYIANPEAMIFSCNTKFYKRINGHLVSERIYEGKKMLLNIDSSIYRPFINTRFYKKEVFDKLGNLKPFNSAGTRFQSTDQEFIIRCAANKIPNVVLKNCYYSYTMHEDSITMAGNKKLSFEMIKEHLDIGEYYIKYHKILSLPDVFKILHWHAKNSVKSVIYAIFFRRYTEAFWLFIRGFKFTNFVFIIKLICRLLNPKRIFT